MKNLESLSDEQLVMYARKNMPVYRRLISKVGSFFRALMGRNIRQVALAGDVTIDVSDLRGNIKSVDKLRLSNFKAPNFSKLRASIKVLQETDALDELTYIVDRLEASPSAKMKAEAKKLRVVLDGMIDTFNSSLELLENLANAHVPAEVGAVFKDAERTVNNRLSSHLGKNVSADSSILVGAENDSIDFARYFYLEDYVQQRLVLIVTCSLTPVGKEYVMSRHVTTETRIQPPFNYEPGPSVSDISSAIKDEMSLHGVLAEVAKVPLNVDRKRITNAISRFPGVVGVEVGDEDIRVRVKSRRQQQFKDIFAALVSDTDVKAQLGRKYRLNGEYDADDTAWVFTIVSK